jgi:hypothetical protein
MHGYLANVPRFLAEQSSRKLADEHTDLKERFRQVMIECGMDEKSANKIWLQMATKEHERKIDNAG